MKSGVKVAGYISAISMIWMGVVFLLPMNTFGFSHEYDAMSRIANENIWGIICLLLGLHHIYSLKFANVRAARLSFLIGAGWWIFIATMFMLGEPASAATTYYILSGASIWGYVEVNPHDH
jgi:hypothetical protein